MIQAQKDDGSIHKDTADCSDVGELVAGKFNRSVEGEERKVFRQLVKVSIAG
jgi:hypothetical protein